MFEPPRASVGSCRTIAAAATRLCVVRLAAPTCVGVFVSILLLLRDAGANDFCCCTGMACHY